LLFIIIYHYYRHYIYCAAMSVESQITCAVFQYNRISGGDSVWSDSGAFKLCCFSGCWFYQWTRGWGASDSTTVWKVSTQYGHWH